MKKLLLCIGLALCLCACKKQTTKTKQSQYPQSWVYGRWKITASFDTTFYRSGGSQSSVLSSGGNLELVFSDTSRVTSIANGNTNTQVILPFNFSKMKIHIGLNDYDVIKLSDNEMKLYCKYYTTSKEISQMAYSSLYVREQ